MPFWSGEASSGSKPGIRFCGAITAAPFRTSESAREEAWRAIASSCPAKTSHSIRTWCSCGRSCWSSARLATVTMDGHGGRGRIEGGGLRATWNKNDKMSSRVGCVSGGRRMRYARRRSSGWTCAIEITCGRTGRPSTLLDGLTQQGSRCKCTNHVSCAPLLGSARTPTRSTSDKQNSSPAANENIHTYVSKEYQASRRKREREPTHLALRRALDDERLHPPRRYSTPNPSTFHTVS